MASGQNGTLTKWQVEKMAVEKMAGLQNGKLTKWQVDKLAT
jgi:hypothetical protein